MATRAEVQGHIYRTQIVGAGPAGIGPFVAADRQPKGLQSFLNHGGTVIINPTYELGPGRLARINIISNSPGGDFTEGVNSHGELGGVLATESAKTVNAYKDTPLPLPNVAKFLEDLGTQIGRSVETHPQSAVLEGKVAWVDQVSDGNGGFYESKDAHGRVLARSKNIVLAAGGQEVLDPSLNPYKDRVLLSRDILTSDALPQLQGLLSSAKDKHVIIIGGAHSGFAASAHILEKLTDRNFTITILSRNGIKVFYNSQAEARAHGYSYSDKDVCPETDRVHRFPGLRGPAKDLYTAIQSGAERRVRIKRYGNFDEATEILDHAGAIIQASGYAAVDIPIFEQGKRIGPHRDNGGIVTTKDAQVVGESGEVLPNVYAIGLRHGELDGVNVYHGPIGAKIFEEIQSR